MKIHFVEEMCFPEELKLVLVLQKQRINNYENYQDMRMAEMIFSGSFPMSPDQFVCRVHAHEREGVLKKMNDEDKVIMSFLGKEKPEFAARSMCNLPRFWFLSLT